MGKPSVLNAKIVFWLCSKQSVYLPIISSLFVGLYISFSSNLVKNSLLIFLVILLIHLIIYTVLFQFQKALIEHLQSCDIYNTDNITQKATVNEFWSSVRTLLAPKKEKGINLTRIMLLFTKLCFGVSIGFGVITIASVKNKINSSINAYLTNDHALIIFETNNRIDNEPILFFNTNDRDIINSGYQFDEMEKNQFHWIFPRKEISSISSISIEYYYQTKLFSPELKLSEFIDLSTLKRRNFTVNNNKQVTDSSIVYSGRINTLVKDASVFFIRNDNSWTIDKLAGPYELDTFPNDSVEWEIPIQDLNNKVDPTFIVKLVCGSDTVYVVQNR